MSDTSNVIARLSQMILETPPSDQREALRDAVIVIQDLEAQLAAAERDIIEALRKPVVYYNPAID